MGACCARCRQPGLPLLLGTTLALGLGWVSAERYLHLIGSTLRIPTGFIWPMPLSAIIGACLVAWVTSLTANPRIRPELIRAA